LKEKQQQRNALMLLKEYITDLIKTEYLVDDQLRTAKHDQKDIINEIDNVKAELDELLK
jgi:vacuolar-type H+-ATPase subunit H